MNHDLDDAMRAGLFAEGDVPAEIRRVLGEERGRRFRTLVRDVIRGSDLDGGGHIQMSPEVHAALLALRDFLYMRVYENPVVHDEFVKAQRILRDLWAWCLEDPARLARALRRRAARRRDGRARRHRLALRDDRPVRARDLGGALRAAPVGRGVTGRVTRRATSPLSGVTETWSVRLTATTLPSGTSMKPFWERSRLAKATAFTRRCGRTRGIALRASAGRSRAPRRGRSPRAARSGAARRGGSPP